MKKFLGLFILFFFYLFSTNDFVFAQNAEKPFADCTVTLASGDVVPTLSCIFPLIATGISWLLLFSGVTAVIFIIFSGIKFIMSSGEAKQLEAARKIFTYAILGLVLIFLSFAIIRFIAQITGVACINPRNPVSFTTCGSFSGNSNPIPTTCTSQGGVCYTSGTCPVVGTGIAKPVDGWSDCSGVCCSQ